MAAESIAPSSSETTLSGPSLTAASSFAPTDTSGEHEDPATSIAQAMGKTRFTVGSLALLRPSRDPGPHHAHARTGSLDSAPRALARGSRLAPRRRRGAHARHG